MTADYYVPPSAPRAWTYSKPTAVRPNSSNQNSSDNANNTNNTNNSNDTSNSSPDFFGDTFASTTATNIIFLSLRLHKARPNHLELRMNRFPYRQPPGARYDYSSNNTKNTNGNTSRTNLLVHQLRVVLVLVDVERYEALLDDILTQTLPRDFTMVCAWSPEEAMAYVEGLLCMQKFSLDPGFKKYDGATGIAEVGLDPVGKNAARLKDQTDSYLDGKDFEEEEKNGNGKENGEMETGKEDEVQDDSDLGILAGWGGGSSTASKRQEPDTDTEPTTINDITTDDSIATDTNPAAAFITTDTTDATNNSNKPPNPRTAFLSLPLRDRTNMISALSRLPHVSNKDAEEALKRYGSIAAAVLDNGRELRGLPGWGPRKVDEFVKAFCEPFIDTGVDEGLGEDEE